MTLALLTLCILMLYLKIRSTILLHEKTYHSTLKTTERGMNTEDSYNHSGQNHLYEDNNLMYIRYEREVPFI